MILRLLFLIVVVSHHVASAQDELTSDVVSTTTTTVGVATTTNKPIATTKKLGSTSVSTNSTAFFDKYFLDYRDEVWFYPSIAAVAVCLIGIVVAIVCIVRCCCCHKSDNSDIFLADADVPNFYGAAPLAYRQNTVPSALGELPIIHLPASLPKSGVLEGTERAALPVSIAPGGVPLGASRTVYDPHAVPPPPPPAPLLLANPLPPAPPVAPGFERPAAAFPDPTSYLQGETTTQTMTMVENSDVYLQYYN